MEEPSQSLAAMGCARVAHLVQSHTGRGENSPVLASRLFDKNSANRHADMV